MTTTTETFEDRRARGDVARERVLALPDADRRDLLIFVCGYDPDAVEAALDWLARKRRT